MAIIVSVITLLVGTANTALADARFGYRDNNTTFSHDRTPNYSTRAHTRTKATNTRQRYSHSGGYYRSQFDRPNNRSYRGHSGNRFLEATHNNRHKHSISHTNRHSSLRNISHDNWSVNINLGTGFSSGWYAWGLGRSGFHNPVYTPAVFTSGISHGFAGTRTFGVVPLVTRSRVIVNQPTVIYVNDSTARPGHVVSRSRPVANSGRSLLRDIHGNCFERFTDSRGNETRTQIDPAACNF